MSAKQNNVIPMQRSKSKLKRNQDLQSNQDIQVIYQNTGENGQEDSQLEKQTLSLEESNQRNHEDDKNDLDLNPNSLQVVGVVDT